MATGVIHTNPAPGVYVAEWGNLATIETGVAASIPMECASRSVQVSGVFGAAGSVAIQGSNDGVVWAPLSNSFVATALAITAAGIHDILQSTRFIRPVVTGGDGTTALKVTIAAV